MTRIGRRTFLKRSMQGGAAVAALRQGAKAWAQGGREDAPGCTTCRAIDMHAHWEPEAYIKAMAELGVDIKPDTRNFDLPRRLKYMDDHGVQIHVLTLNAPPWRHVEPRVGARIASIVNDAAIEAHTAYPDRFYGAVCMPIEDPSLALAELNRVAGRPGIRAVHLLTSHLGEDYLFEKAFEPIYARCAELGYPLLFHPLNVRVIGHDRLDDPEQAGINNSIGYPMEHTTIAARYIYHGVLDRHPKLRLLLSHGGGAFPYLAGRIEQGFLRRGVRLNRPFREQARQFYYDTITFYPETLRYLIEFAGPDNVVVGTDNFQLMDVEPTWLLHQLKLPAADMTKIIRGNAERLLQL